MTNPLAAADLCADSAEALARLETAACYRLISLFDLDDMSDGFVSCRVMDEPDSFVVGGYALFPEEARASELYKRSLSAEPSLEHFGGVDIDAHNFSRTTMNARPEFNACIHAHSEFAVAFSSMDCTIEPISQYGIMFHDRTAYMDFYDSDVTAGDACGTIETLFQQGAELIVLRNHGLLVPGRTVAQAFFHLYRIEQACRYQVRAMAAGAARVTPDRVSLDSIRKQYWTQTQVHNDGQREWPGLIRKLDRLDPSFRE
ncbi:MAG: class II aldolase/adducin family protein [Pseudomonadota bacterium]